MTVDFKQEFSAAHEKLVFDLRREIYRKSLLPGDKLYSEMHLAKKYSISRSTVRKALDTLCDEKLICKVQGAGTFVCSTLPDQRMYSFSKDTKNRQILFLSFSSAITQTTVNQIDTYEPIVHGIGKVLKSYRYNLLMDHVDIDYTPPVSLINGDIAGIIFHGYVRQDFYDQYMKNLPLVGLQHINFDFQCNWVKADNIMCEYLAVRHLYDLGHRRIAFIQNSVTDNYYQEECLTGFRHAMRNLNLPVNEEWIKNLQSSSSSFDFLSGCNIPTAIITSESAIAEVKQELNRRGLRIPQDISVISRRNQPGFHHDHMTFICDNFETVCSTGARTLIELLENPDDRTKKTILIRPRLIPGDSTRKL